MSQDTNSRCCNAEVYYDCEDEHVYCLECDRPVSCVQPGCRTPAQHFNDADEPICELHAAEAVTR